MERIEHERYANDEHYLGTWVADRFQLHLWDNGNMLSDGTGAMSKHLLSYKLFDDGFDRGPLSATDPLFWADDDYAVAPTQAIDSDEAVAGLLAFLSLKPGDTDDDYFKDYTPAQRRWLESDRPDDLQAIVHEIEELAARPALDEVDVEPGPLSRPSAVSDSYELER